MNECSNMAKNLFVAYVLWLFLGWWGVHHFYLGRDRQAFVWWATCGGLFGLGWVRDIWHLPTYVDSANEEPYYMQRLAELMRLRKSPPFNPSRFIGQMCFGTFIGFLSMLSISEDYSAENPLLRRCIVPCAIAIAVHAVGNIGRETCQFMWAVTGAFVPALKFIDRPQAVVYMALFSAILSQRNRGFRKILSHSSWPAVCRRLLVLIIAASVITGMWGSALYFNASVTTSDGETIKFRDAVDHFFSSPIWKEFKETVKDLFREGLEHGWADTWSRFVQALDPEGEQNAHEVLGLAKGATESEVTKRYRQLVRLHHPDKNRDGNQEEVAETFMKIQQAYETLSKIHERRVRKNRRMYTEGY